MGVRPFSRVLIDGGKICALGSDSMDSQDLPPSERRPCWLIAETLSARDLHRIHRMGGNQGSRRWPFEVRRAGDSHVEQRFQRLREFIQSISEHIVRIDPDILVTDKGDSIDFPALLSEALSEKIDLRFGRGGKVDRRRGAVTNWSYGELQDQKHITP